MYERITRGIKVIVRPHYLEGQSKPDEGQFMWAYTIVVENHGRETVTLRTRYWKITDANGKVQEVEGEGVVGEQPWLRPGEGFVYTSGAVLETSLGTMEGSYAMLADDGTQFDAPIPAFSLAVPRTLH